MEKILIIIIRCVKDILILSAEEQSPDEQKTLGYHENHAISYDEINNHCTYLFNLLNKSGKQAKVDKNIFEEIKFIGQSLFDLLFTVRIKELIKKTDTQFLILKIDGNLVQVPWELLHDGSFFLCQRFSIGRKVSTTQKITSQGIRKPQKPFKMLILADPKGNLDAAYEEGIILHRKFNELKEEVLIDLKTTSINTQFIKKSLREHDIIHYAGHAEYDLKDPYKSGWQTTDGILSTINITNMSGGAPLPFLVFSNACQSGQTEPWHLASDNEKGVYGLANAFLLSGVQHYIGTFWDIPDKAGLRMAVAFYRNLLNGLSIGQSLKNARVHLIKHYGEENPTWMAYMLYGDPAFIYFRQNSHSLVTGKEKEEKDSGEKAKKEKCDILYQDRQYKEWQLANEPTRRDGSKAVLRKPFPFVKNRSLWPAIFICSVILIFGVAYNIYKHFTPIPSFQSKIPAEISQSEIDRLLEDIDIILKNQLEKKPVVSEDTWTSRPMTMAILVHLSKSNNDLTKNEKMQRHNEIIAQRINTALQSTSSIPMLDREHLEDILREYKLSLYNFVDKEQDLIHVARFLGARLILFSELRIYEKKYYIDICVIETETSVQKLRFSHPVGKKIKYEPAANQVAKRIVKEIGNLYPLKCIIKTLHNPDEVELNIGSGVGLRPGLILTALGKSGEPGELGRLKVKMTDQDHSIAFVLEIKRPLQNGDRAISDTNPYQ